MTAKLPQPQPLYRTICKIVPPEGLESTKDRLTYLGYRITLIKANKDGGYVVQAVEEAYRASRRDICEC